VCDSGYHGLEGTEGDHLYDLKERMRISVYEKRELATLLTLKT
jgi:hypothetical protein